MLLKCKSTPVKVGLRYTLTLNSPLQIVGSTSRNGSKAPEASSHVKRRLGCWLLSTFKNNCTSVEELKMANTSSI